MKLYYACILKVDSEIFPTSYVVYDIISSDIKTIYSEICTKFLEYCTEDYNENVKKESLDIQSMKKSLDILEKLNSNIYINITYDEEHQIIRRINNFIDTVVDEWIGNARGGLEYHQILFRELNTNITIGT